MSKAFDRILIVMFENQYRSYVLQNSFLKKLASAGAEMGNYFGAFHPSQTNYVASLAGEVCAVTNDTPPASPLPQQTLVDILEPAGVSWKAYMEGYPGEDWNEAWKRPDYPPDAQPLNEFPADGMRLARYFRKHNAFASFHSIQADPTRWQRIVGEQQFWSDVADDALPEYAWFTPDIWNDGHYLYNTHVDTNPRTQLVPQVASWLEYVFLGDIAVNKVQDAAGASQAHWGLHLDVDLLLSDPAAAWKQSRLPPRTLLVITFDEADYDALGYDTNYDGPNQIYTVLLGDMIEPGTVIDAPLNHYSLMRTVERNFATADLGKNDRDSNWFRFLWDEQFAWSDVSETGITATGEIALAGAEDGASLIYQDEQGQVMCSDFDGDGWSAGTATGIQGATSLAAATVEGRHVVVYAQADGQLFASVREGTAWTEEEPLGQRTAGGIALAAYVDVADQQSKLMLCWPAEDGFIKYLICEHGQWPQQAQEVGQLTDGPLALAQLGPSLYLIYKERNRSTMRMTSYNLAPFNAFDALQFDDSPDPRNGTSLHQWSPFDVPVGHFAGKLSKLQNDYRAQGRLALATLDGEMRLVHRAAYADTPQAYSEVFGLTGIFTARSASSSGWGTIEQAGWTREEPLPGVQLDPDSGIAQAAAGGRLLLVWQASGGGGLKYCTGGYRAANGS